MVTRVHCNLGGDLQATQRESGAACSLSPFVVPLLLKARHRGAVRAIGEIGEIGQQIYTFQGSVAAAVEQQSMTTDSIAASVRESQNISQQISSTLSGVSGAAQGGGEAVFSTRGLAADVAGTGEALRRVVARFRV